MTVTRLARAAVASVWLYEGLWCKILRVDPDQRAIVAAVPGPPAAVLRGALTAIGAVETGVAGWVISGRARRGAAVAQTGLIVFLNAGGLAVGRDRIAHPARMLATNAVLVAAAWLLADRD